MQHLLAWRKLFITSRYLSKVAYLTFQIDYEHYMRKCCLTVSVFHSGVLPSTNGTHSHVTHVSTGKQWDPSLCFIFNQPISSNTYSAEQTNKPIPDPFLPAPPCCQIELSVPLISCRSSDWMSSYLCLQKNKNIYSQIQSSFLGKQHMYFWLRPVLAFLIKFRQ